MLEKQKHEEKVHEDINLNDLFMEPTVGSVELLDEYEESWATIIDESADSVTSDSMLTAQEGWSSDLEERDQSIGEQQGFEGHKLGVSNIEQVNVPNQLIDEVSGIGKVKCQVAGEQGVRKWNNLIK